SPDVVAAEGHLGENAGDGRIEPGVDRGLGRTEAFGVFGPTEVTGTTIPTTSLRGAELPVVHPLAVPHVAGFGIALAHHDRVRRPVDDVPDLRGTAAVEHPVQTGLHLECDLGSDSSGDRR